MPNYFFSASLSPSDGNDTFFILKETLKAVGFTVPSSSNGTTFSAGDILSSSTDFGSNAWFIVRQPQGATASYGEFKENMLFNEALPPEPGGPSILTVPASLEVLMQPQCLLH